MAFATASLNLAGSLVHTPSLTSSSLHGEKLVAGHRCPTGACIFSSSRSTNLGVRSQATSESYASVSQSSTAPVISSDAVVPAVIGAGIVGAAAFLLGKQTASAPVAPAVAAPAESPAVPRAKMAAPSALETMSETFPSAVQEGIFMKAVAQELAKFGFNKYNCIALVNTCRDEVCRPLVNLVDEEFGLSFNTSGLGGLVNCGKTGFKAAMSHSPEFPCDKDGKPRERYIFMAFPHVSIGETGEVGSLLRRGRGKASNACGALIAIMNDVKARGKDAKLPEDDDDMELVLLRCKVAAKISSNVPDLVEITKGALGAITEDLERLIAATVDPATADYAVITGVQIHSGNQIPGQPFRIERTCDYIAPSSMYAVIRGEKKILHPEVAYATILRQGSLV